MLFDYINSLDSQTLKTMGTRSQETGFSLSVYAHCHGFTRANKLGLLTWRNVRALNPISIYASSERMEIIALENHLVL